MMTAIVISLLLPIPASYIVGSTMCRFEKPCAVRSLGREVKQSEAVWLPATYHGLTIGKSRGADMLRILGKPKWSEPFNEDRSNAEVWYHYPSKDIPGEIVVNVDKKSKVILRLLIYPEHLSKEEAIKYFGVHFITTRYEFCEGFEDAESAPLYETPSGRLSFIEYRDKGIAISFDDDDKVTAITYASEPIGGSASNCKPTHKCK